MLVLSGLFTSSLTAAGDITNLLQQLQKTFVPTEFDAGGMKVAKGGTVVTVQIDGVLANPKGKTGSYKNMFEDGQIRPENCLKCQLTNRLATQRAYQAGERLYVVALELGGKDSIAMEVQSCGTCDPKAIDPTHRPYQARVTFKFLKGALAATSVAQVQQVVEQVFKADAEGGATQETQQQGAPPPAAPARPPVRARTAGAPPDPQANPPQAEAPPKTPTNFDPIAPPPPPADTPEPQPRKLEMGQTIDQVNAMFPGIAPTTVPGPNKAVIHLYKDGNRTFKITFTDGKVTGVDVI
jgi:hypothetical protein